MDAVERAEQTRAPIQKTADRLAGYLVYFALACATFTFLVTRDARSTISVVIVAGACGIAAGTPLAILGAIGRAARAGAIIKGGLYLEALGHVDTVVLDKTGTLTLGVPEVVAVRPVPGVEERDVLLVAGVAEKRSEHPLARAILSRLGTPPGEPEQFSYTPGLGIVCNFQGHTIIVGSRTLLTNHGIALDACPAAPTDLTEMLIARSGRLLGTSTSPTCCDPRRSPRSRRCEAWGCGRCCSPAIALPSPRRSGSSSPWTRSVAASCRARRWNG